MKRFQQIFIFFFIALLPLTGFAQNATIKGVVTDNETSEPLGFVNVSTMVENETRGAQTDYDGNYSLSLPAGSYTITYSYVGYTERKITQKVLAGDMITLNIAITQKTELLDQLVVTAGKFEQKLGEQTVSLEVIKPSMVENTNSTAIDQTIQRIPGVDVVDGQANIRGGSGYSYGAGSRVMLLMDDIPVLTADAGFPNWDFLPIENLEQVEIIKGASSALYGSSAMNGIINMRTAYPKSKPEGKITFFTGMYQNPRDNEVIRYDEDGAPVDTVNKGWWGGAYPIETGGSFAYKRKFDQFDLVTGGYFFNETGWRRPDYGRMGRINVNTRYRFKNRPGLSVGVNTNIQKNTSASFLIWDKDDGGSSAEGAYLLYKALPPINNNGFKATLDPFVEYFTASGFKIKVLGRYYRNNNQNDTNQSTKSDFYYGEAQAQKRFEDIAFTITGGLVGNYAKADAELYGGGAKFSSSNLAAYAQFDKKFFEKLNLSFGARYEYNEIEGDKEAKPVFRAGANYQAAQFTFIRASFGQAYRFPTIAEKYVSTNLGNISVEGLPIQVPFGIFPNENLDSETGWSGEIGIKQGIKISDWKGFIDVSGFINEYNNMMEFTFGVNEALRPLLGTFNIWNEYADLVNPPVTLTGNAGTGFQSINIGDTRIFGLDCTVAGTGKVFGLPVNALIGYTWITPTFQDFDTLQNVLSSSDENILKYRFRHTVKADIEGTFIQKLTIGGNLQYYSFMEAIDEAFNRLLPGIQEFREEHNGGTLVIDGRLNYRVTESASVAFICKNMTNLEYALRPGLIDPPRSYNIRFSYSF